MTLKARDIPVLLSPPLLTQCASSVRQLARAQIARLRARDLSKLHLACGSNLLPNWANVDLEGSSGVIKLDLTSPLPFASNSMDYVYSEHFIEHITLEHGQRLLRECYRVLRVGGVLRVSTPDLRKIVAQYQAGRLDEWRDMNWHPKTPASLLNEGLRLWGHQFLYDIDDLQSAFRQAGFGAMEQVAWRQSRHEALAGLECRPFHDELIFECTK